MTATSNTRSSHRCRHQTELLGNLLKCSELKGKAEAKMMPDGTMVSVPLEDLAPFLPDEELKENMIVPMVKNE